MLASTAPQLIYETKVTSYTITVLLAAAVRAGRGERTWMISVKHARFFDPRARAKPGAAPFDTALMQPFQWAQFRAPSTPAAPVACTEPSVGSDSALRV